MSTPIDAISAAWSDFSPNTVDVTVTTSGTTKRIEWGTPVALGTTRRLSFTPAAPPILSVNVGFEFSLGSLAFRNETITGDQPNTVTLSLRVLVDYVTADFTIVLTRSGATWSLAPQTVNVGELLIIDLLGFQASEGAAIATSFIGRPPVA